MLAFPCRFCLLFGTPYIDGSHEISTASVVLSYFSDVLFVSVAVKNRVQCRAPERTMVKHENSFASMLIAPILRRQEHRKNILPLLSPYRTTKVLEKHIL